MAAMQFWKPHSLAKPHDGQLDLRLGDRVKAIVDLPGIAEGATGKVILANGFNWQRYRVRFTDGTELGDLDHRTSPRSAGPPSGWPRRLPRPAERSYTAHAVRGVAQPGSAPALGAGSRGFESRLPDYVTPGRWVSITAALDIKSPPSRRSVVMSTGSVLAVSYAPVITGAFALIGSLMASWSP